jgi:hypothetical protein
MVGMGDKGDGGYSRYPRRSDVAERMDRAIFNEAVRTQMSPLRPVGSADQYGVPMADEDASVDEE